MIEVRSQSYGKSQVRVSHIRRNGSVHEFIELTCWVELMGDFDAAYTAADNSLVVPTDTMKNTVYVLAKKHGIDSLESFCRLLARHFIDSFSHVEVANVRGAESLWSRMEFGGEPHTHAFVAPGNESNTCDVTAFADDLTQTAGIAGLKVLKTTGSAFTNYLVDEQTTLQPTDDRIFATTIEANWPCSDPEADWTTIRSRIREQLLAKFAKQHSESVQHTLYEMAGAALEACPELSEISLTMPNQHHLLMNLAPFDLENPNEVFVPTDEPFGNISATIARSEAEASA
ncbi:MAG: factor-independent urate hydroxylase [Planctomycetota bacterium]